MKIIIDAGRLLRNAELPRKQDNQAFDLYDNDTKRFKGNSSVDSFF